MSELAKSLLQEKLNLWEQVKGINEGAMTEKRSALTAEETTQRSALMEQIDVLDTRTKDILEDEKRAADATTAYNDFNSRAQVAGKGGVEQRFNEEIRKVWKRESEGIVIPVADSKLLKRMSGMARPLHPAETRTILDNYLPGGTPGSFTNQTGAGIVPIDFYDQLISYLVEVSGIMQTGPTVLSTQGGEPIQMPYVIQHTGQLTGANQYANLGVGQNAALPTSDPGFSQKTLTANKFGIMVQIPRELLDDTGVNLLGYLATSTGRSLGNVVGNALINGGNGITGPLISQVTGGGLITTGTATSGAVSGTGHVPGGPTYADLVGMQYSVIAPYRQSRSAYWLAADQSLGTLRLLTDTNGRPIWEPSMVLGAPDLLLGKPIVADPFMPQIATGAFSIAFGDFSQYVIRLVGDMRFERSDDFAFGTDLVSFRAILRADANLLNPPANISRSQPVAIFKGATT